jgi:hypothetical protein
MGEKPGLLFGSSGFRSMGHAILTGGRDKLVGEGGRNILGRLCSKIELIIGLILRVSSYF